MKILLDECLPLDFRRSFPSHETHTVQWAGLKGKKNGDLLRAAEDADYDILLTVDQGISHQQSLSGRRISVVLIRAPTNQLEDLLPLVDEILKVFDVIRPGRTVMVPAS